MSETFSADVSLNSQSEQSDRFTKIALVISCGRVKVWRARPWLGSVEARDAYVGPLFRACRRYAEVFYPHDWFIFSAKYGLLNPDSKIDNYDASFSTQNTSDVVSEVEIRSQCEIRLKNYAVIVSLAGSLYNRRLAGGLLKNQTLELPLATLGLFDRMKWLKRAVSDSTA